MNADIEDLVRDAVGDPTPSPETDRDVLEAVGRSVQVAPRRRRWEFVVVAAAAIVVAILLLTPEEPGPGQVEPAPLGKGIGEMPVLATAVSEDGRFRLNIEHLELAPPAPGSAENPTLMLQGRAVWEGPRLIAGHLIKVRRVTTPDGVDRTPEGLGYVGSVNGSWGTFAVHRLDLGPEPTKIALLELEMTFLRLRDKDHRFEGIKPGADEEKSLPPYHVGFQAEPSAFRIGVFMTDESIRAAKADLSLAWPGNATVAESARIVDVMGAVLVPMGMNGSGGYASVAYYPDAQNLAGTPIAYPVTVTIPDPVPVERFPVVFTFRDLELPAVRDRRVSASPWGESANGLIIRADLPTRVEQGEPVLAVIEFTRHETGLPRGITRLETRDAEEFLTLRLTPADSGEEIVLRPETLWNQGPPNPPEPGGPEPNLDRDPPPVRTHFPLIPVREKLPPGRYDGIVELVIPGAEKRQPLFEIGNEQLWHGTLRSGRFTLEVVAEPARTATLRLPTRLRLVKGLSLTFGPEDPEEVTVPRKNGHTFGTRIGCEPGTTPGLAFTHSFTSGAPASLENYSILTLPPDHRGPLEVKITVELLDLSRTPGSLAHLQSTYVWVLWSRTFEVSYTAEEIDALR